MTILKMPNICMCDILCELYVYLLKPLFSRHLGSKVTPKLLGVYVNFQNMSYKCALPLKCSLFIYNSRICKKKLVADPPWVGNFSKSKMAA